MKLGALLLKGFRSQPRVLKAERYSQSLSRSKAKTKPTVNPTRQSSSVHVSAANSKSVEAKSGAGRKVAKHKTALAARAKNDNRLARSLEVVEPQTAVLTTAQMIRPDGALRASIDSFLKDQRSPHTRNAYSKDLKRFMKYLIEVKVNRGIESLDRKLIIAYKDFLLSENLSHTTIDRHLATLKSFFRWLTEDGILDRNIAENVRFLNPKKESSTRGFTDKEVTQILRLPDLYTRTGSLHYAVLMILFYCGLRRSELCDLRTSSIGFERGHHYLKLVGKGNAERIVVLRKDVWQAIEHYARMSRKTLRRTRHYLRR